eukprot:86675-Heterocapsa_arctica.AAC.1
MPPEEENGGLQPHSLLLYRSLPLPLPGGTALLTAIELPHPPQCDHQAGPLQAGHQRRLPYHHQSENPSEG